MNYIQKCNQLEQLMEQDASQSLNLALVRKFEAELERQS